MVRPNPSYNREASAASLKAAPAVRQSSANTQGSAGAGGLQRYSPYSRSRSRMLRVHTGREQLVLLVVRVARPLQCPLAPPRASWAPLGPPQPVGKERPRSARPTTSCTAPPLLPLAPPPRPPLTNSMPTMWSTLWACLPCRTPSPRIPGWRTRRQLTTCPLRCTSRRLRLGSRWAPPSRGRGGRGNHP